jgi:ferredoxin--NADP+ reductase
MNRILEKKKLAENVYWYKVENPDIARARKPGQFLILRVHDKGERIPLTIVNSTQEEGSIEIIFQVVGKSTKLLTELNEGDHILDIAGPLGTPTHIEYYGVCAMIGGGIGIAPLLPIAKGFKEKGNKIISVLGARSKSLLILEEEMRHCSDAVHVTTDDGSYGEKGLVTDMLRRICESNQQIDYVVAIGPVNMMKEVSELTKTFNIRTLVSLNPIMVDGTGMCGGCRCYVKGESKFACIHGPEFNGHEVDFDKLARRLTMFKESEQQAMNHACKIDKD